MCSGSKPKPAPPPPPPPPPPPAPPPVAQLAVESDKNPDSNAAKAAKQKSGRSALRIQRQAGIGGADSEAGLSVPKG